MSQTPNQPTTAAPGVALSPSDAALLDRLGREPWSADFFQALRRAECAHPELPRIGRSTRPQHDAVRLGQDASLGFAPSAVSAVRGGADGKLEVRVLHFGLLGPNAPMPMHLTEHVRNRALHHGDHATRAFLDLFNHRALSLFYAAWSESRPAVSHDRPDDDRFARRIAALIGLATPGLSDRDLVPDVAKLHHAGSLGRPIPSVEAIEQVLGAFFEVPCEVRPFAGAWLDLPEDSRLRLGRDGEGCQLGVGAVIGGRVWDRQHMFAVRLGPMGIDQFRRLLPGAPGYAHLRAWVLNLVGAELACVARLVLKKEEAPRTVLGREGSLGRSTWLTTGPLERDPEDVTIRVA